MEKQMLLLSFCDNESEDERIDLITIFRKVRYNRIKIINSRKVLVVARDRIAAERIIKEKNRWIEKKIKQMREMERMAAVANGKCYLFGEEKNISEVIAAVRDCRKILFSHAVDYVSKLTEIPPSISIRAMHSRLGSYSIKNDEIKLSAYLSFLPKEMINYVIFHELTHRKIKHHGKEFWQAIAEKYPDWKEREKELDIWWIRVKNLLASYPLLRNI